MVKWCDYTLASLAQIGGVIVIVNLAKQLWQYKRNNEIIYYLKHCHQYSPLHYIFFDPVVMNFLNPNLVG